MNTLKTAASLTLIALGSGCGTTEPLIPDKSWMVSPCVEISYEALAGAPVAAGIVWYVADPLALDVGHRAQEAFGRSLSHRPAPEAIRGGRRR